MSNGIKYTMMQENIKVFANSFFDLTQIPFAQLRKPKAGAFSATLVTAIKTKESLINSTEFQ